MDKIVRGLVGLGVGIALLLGISTNAGAAEAPSCLSAARSGTYALCEALWVQPAYGWTNEDGSQVGVPGGPALLAELADDGVTPTHSAKAFRRATEALTGEYFDHMGGSESQDGSPCLLAVGPRTYRLCAALWDQPGYDREDGLTNPEGSEIIAELAEEGKAPQTHADEFRREARSEIRGYFEHCRE